MYAGFQKMPSPVRESSLQNTLGLLKSIDVNSKFHSFKGCMRQFKVDS